MFRFVALNHGDSRDASEAELFGHVPRRIHGAVGNRQGRLEQVNKERCFSTKWGR